MTNFEQNDIPAGSGTVTYTFTPDGSQSHNYFYIYGHDGFDGTIDNVSVKIVGTGALGWYYNENNVTYITGD